MYLFTAIYNSFLNTYFISNGQYWFAVVVVEINESAVGIDMTSPCEYPVPVGLEKEYIPDANMWTTSQINALRGARFARLRGWKGLFFSQLILLDFLML